MQDLLFKNRKYIKLLSEIIQITILVLCVEFARMCEIDYWYLIPTFYIMYKIINKILDKMYGTYNAEFANMNFPVYRKRFTSKDAVGNVIYNPSDSNEMASYLAEIEDILEKCGKYR